MDDPIPFYFLITVEDFETGEREQYEIPVWGANREDAFLQITRDWLHCNPNVEDIKPHGWHIVGAMPAAEDGDDSQ